MVLTEPVKPKSSEAAELKPPSVGPGEVSPIANVTRHKPTDEEVLKRIRDLPPEIAVLLISVGCLGFVLPGVVGTPAIVAGGLVLWPSKFARVEAWFEKQFPKIHHKSMEQMNRFLDDLERRYPTRTNEPR